jgi:predicted PurR-regulated permease PerM
VAGYPHIVWIVVFLVVWRILQDYVNMPWVLGSGIELHPLLVIFGILAGAEVGGVAGMFLSIPTMATVRILVRRAAGVRRR